MPPLGALSVTLLALLAASRLVDSLPISAAVAALTPTSTSASTLTSKGNRMLVPIGDLTLRRLLGATTDSPDIPTSPETNMKVIEESITEEEENADDALMRVIEANRRESERKEQKGRALRKKSKKSKKIDEDEDEDFDDDEDEDRPRKKNNKRKGKAKKNRRPKSRRRSKDEDDEDEYDEDEDDEDDEDEEDEDDEDDEEWYDEDDDASSQLLPHSCTLATVLLSLTVLLQFI